MSKQKQHIMFFSPSMQRTGSEIVLLNLLNHLSDNYNAIIVSKYKGPLLSFVQSRITASYLYSKPTNSIFSRIIFKIKSNFITPLILKRYKDFVWYINTIVTPDILNFAAKHKVKVILHVHELEHMFALLNKEQLEQTIHYPEVIIANSNYTKQLIQRYGRTKPIELCYPAIDTKKFKEDKVVKVKYRSQLNIPQNHFVWAMCGTLDDNKNPELFIDIACELLKSKPNAIFLWIGGTNDKEFADKIKNKANQKISSDKIIWIDSVEEEYQQYFSCADGFVLTSKKESFSIVTLEALLLGVPVVTHDCGGVKEILKDDIGTIIKEKNDVQQFVEAMNSYMDNISAYDRNKGIERAKEFDIEIWSKKWNSILDNFIK